MIARPPMLLLLALLAFAATLRGVLLPLPVAEAYFSRSWLEDASGYEQALKQQRLHHAPVLVYFRVDWCPHCRNLDQMLEAYDLRSRLNGIIKVRVNPEHGEAEKALFKGKHGATGYPSLFLSVSEGQWSRLRYSAEPEKLLAQLPK